MGKPRYCLSALAVLCLSALYSCSYSGAGKPDGYDGDGGDGHCKVTFNLLNPCEEDLLSDPRCDMLMVVLSSVDPRSPWYPGNSPGSIARQCQKESSACFIGCDSIIGSGMIVDVVCEDQPGKAFARAVSHPLMLPKDVAEPVDLLLGKVNGFMKTTQLEGAGVGTCSTLAQDGGRYGHTATRLDDGRILIVGGIRRIGQVEEILGTAEIFDPKTGVHRQIIGPGGRPLAMNASSGRAFHSATKLRDGNVLITGGVGIVESKWAALRSSEVFDVKTETFPVSLIAVSGSTRANHAATMLTVNSKVLVTGGAVYDGQNIIGYLDGAELYDPSANTWAPAGNTMSSARAFHTATELDPNGDQGKVIITGGSDATGPLRTVDIYDPAGNRFYLNADPLLQASRAHHCAVRLQNGEVLVAGGTTTGDVADVSAGVEIYSSSLGGAFGGFRQMTLNLSNARMDHTCTLLEATGDVLVAGGLTASGLATGSGELVTVDQGPVYAVEPLTDLADSSRYLHSAAPLGNGLVFIAGGLPSQAPDAQAIPQSTLFVPEPRY